MTDYSSQSSRHSRYDADICFFFWLIEATPEMAKDACNCEYTMVACALVSNHVITCSCSTNIVNSYQFQCLFEDIAFSWFCFLLLQCGCLSQNFVKTPKIAHFHLSFFSFQLKIESSTNTLQSSMKEVVEGTPDDLSLCSHPQWRNMEPLSTRAHQDVIKNSLILLQASIGREKTTASEFELCSQKIVALTSWIKRPLTAYSPRCIQAMGLLWIPIIIELNQYLQHSAPQLVCFIKGLIYFPYPISGYNSDAAKKSVL